MKRFMICLLLVAGAINAGEVVCAQSTEIQKPADCCLLELQNQYKQLCESGNTQEAEKVLAQIMQLCEKAKNEIIELAGK